MLERAEELSITVEHKVPAMEVECSERERGETLLTAEHLKITGIFNNRFPLNKSCDIQFPFC